MGARALPRALWYALLRRLPTVDLSSHPLVSGLAFVFLFQGYTAVPGQFLFKVGLAFFFHFSLSTDAHSFFLVASVFLLTLVIFSGVTWHWLT